MKFLLTLGLWVLLVPIGWSQTAEIDRLEAKLPALTGTAFAETANALSQAYYQSEDISKAIERAGRAYEAAMEVDDRNEAAIARTNEARALLELRQARREARRRAIQYLVQSNDLTTDTYHRITNLNLLIDIVPKRDVADLQEQLRLIRRESITESFEQNEPTGLGTLFGKKRRETEAELDEVKEENEALTDEIDLLANERRRLRDMQDNLQKTIRRQNSAIETMNEEQAKAELALTRQRRLLDSMTFEGRLDSLRILEDSIRLVQVDTEAREAKALAKASASQRNFMLAVGAFLLLGIFGFYYRWNKSKKFNRELAEKNELIEAERHRSEELLLNILPKSVAEELKASGFAQAKSYTEATVLFTDFVNFSKIAATLSPEELVSDLDHCFRGFDRIVDKHGLEKIKTIGDAYMCAGGLPALDTAHPAKVIRAALEMQDFLRTWNTERQRAGKPALEARIGIHTGPVVAGVVGERKYAYDIWGDTVNVASRMESSGEGGRVNISATTYELVRNKFNFERRGAIPAKGIGEVEMYFVEPQTAAVV